MFRHYQISKKNISTILEDIKMLQVNFICLKSPEF